MQARIVDLLAQISIDDITGTNEGRNGSQSLIDVFRISRSPTIQ